MGIGASPLAVALVVLTVAAPRLAAQDKPPAPPEPPSPAAAGKPSSDALAQEAEGKPNQPEKEKKPPSPWSGHVAAGFNFTKGNSDIRTFNASLVLVYDPHTRNVVKADAFYILAYESGASTVDRTSAHLRDERALAPRWFVFADAQYLKDRFKRIDYLVTPNAGVGYRLLKSEARQLDVDAGAGAVFERDAPGQRTSGGALRAGEAFTWKISKTAVLSNRAFAVWKLGNRNDAYYHVDIGLAAAIADHFELKVALIDEYKRRPPDPTVKRNDLAGIVSVGFTF